MRKFWVVGGIYADTDFEKIAQNHALEKIGPFDTYDTAKAAWQKRAWETVDQANARFQIVEEDEAPLFWVIGGPYQDTHFREPVSGGGEEWHGPFSSYEEAKAEWARLSWAHVDDALCRFRIEKLSASARTSTEKAGKEKKN